MKQSTLRRPSRLWCAHAVLALLIVQTIGSAQAQQGTSACTLLQVSELETAIGAKASAKPSGSKQSVPGMTLDECSLVLKSPAATHPVHVQIVSNLGMDGAQALNIRNGALAREPQWKVAGARLEQATIGTALCILAGRPSVASHTTCSIPRGEGYVEVEVIGPVTDLPSMATIAGLVQKAVSRL
jgi:hypothetical protein